jgi:hypothetical protein
LQPLSKYIFLILNNFQHFSFSLTFTTWII